MRAALWTAILILCHCQLINYPRRIQRPAATAVASKPARIIDPQFEEATKLVVSTIGKAMRDFEITANESDPDFQLLAGWSKAFRHAYAEAVGVPDDKLSITSQHYVLPWSPEQLK